ncbi:hypothetical protein RUM44_002231 [Polyplax serrata]|uniref:Uncharacterized protein n=1 Tax=Polyplax serrata TaxID=468196 RepID=A0ABR1AM92_POLSC
MGKIGLKIKASLTNVDKLYPHKPEQFGWALKVRCTGCGEESPNWHLISEEDVVELVNATANFVYKCKCCARENSLKIIPLSQLNAKSRGPASKISTEAAYLSEDEDKFKTIVGFDCRGMELTEYEPRDGWAVESGNKVFDDVDLSSKDWCEYNDVDNVPVEINDFQSQFETLK